MHVFEQAGAAAPARVPSATEKAAARAVEQARASSAAGELFGSFHLDGQEYALPASCIREVVNFPDKMIPVPLAPPFLEGVFTLRGQVIPVLHLGRIFDPAAAPAARSDKIAIVDHGELQVGVLFHSTGEVLRIRPEQRSMLEYREGARAVVAGTIVLDDGARLLQILDASALADIENVPHVHMLRNIGRHGASAHAERRALRRQCVSFHVGGTAFAFDIAAIREIITVPELKPSVMAGPLCLGRINFRGDPVAVIDFAALLQFGERAPQAAQERRILVALVGATQIGFLVDSVDSIFHFTAEEVLPIPLLSRARAGMFTGCVSRDDGDILFLNHEGIFSQAELLEIGDGHARLYKDEAAAACPTAGGARRARAGRAAYVVFSLDTQWAVEIGQLREIISWRSGMVRPPGLPDFVHGILNLRQQMISVIDLRRVYGMAPAADPDNCKIMIIERGAEYYGLVVDAVDNIVSASAAERRASPRMLAAGSGGRALAREVLDMTAADGSASALNVFDQEALCALVERALHGATCK